MRRKFEELKQTLKAFVDQTDYLTLVINCTDDELLYVVKMLQGIEQETRSDLFLVFPQGASSGDDYVTAIAASLTAQIEGANAMKAQEGQAVWPPLPPDASNRRVPAATRLRTIIDHVRTLVPSEDDHRIIWGFVPISIGNVAEYASLVGEFLPRSGFEPWMSAHRIILRDDRKKPFLVPRLRHDGLSGVLIYDVDYSTEAAADALVQEAQDPTLSMSDRMMALLQLAAMDFAHKRFDQGIEKYGVLFQYYGEHEQPVMQSLCLGGVGDILRSQGKLEDGKRRYQQGVAMAVPTGNLPVMLNLLLGVAEACMGLRHWAEAEGYFDLASQVAAKVMNVPAKCDAMDRMGTARIEQRNPVGAMAAWRGASNLYKDCGQREHYVGLLERMIALSSDARLVNERRQLQEELRLFNSGKEQGDRA